MSIFFVKGSVNHNGVQYNRGEEIDLDSNSANVLLALGEVTEEVASGKEATVVAAPSPEETSATAFVGGEPLPESGEPSVDGVETPKPGIIARIFGAGEETKTEGEVVATDVVADGVPTPTATDEVENPIKDPSEGL